MGPSKIIRAVAIVFACNACRSDTSKASTFSPDPAGYCSDDDLAGKVCYGSKAECIGDLHPDEPPSKCHAVSELWMFQERFDSWKPSDPPIRRYYTTRAKCDSSMEQEARSFGKSDTHATISECHHVP